MRSGTAESTRVAVTSLEIKININSRSRTKIHMHRSNLRRMAAHYDQDPKGTIFQYK